MANQKIIAIPKFECKEYQPKQSKYFLCIPIINEGE